MSVPLRYDIKMHSPHKGLDDRDPDFNETAKLTYYEINFMIHLMWGLPYSVVHGKFSDLIDGILGNVNSDTTWPTPYYGAKNTLTTVLNDIKQMDAVQNELIHLDLYLARVPDDSDERAFINACDALRDSLIAISPRFRLCLPFIEVQNDSSHTFPDDHQKDDIRRWSRDIQHFTIYSLYSSTEALAKKSAVRNLRQRHVLQARRYSPLAGGQGNNYKCQDNDCIHSPGDFCSKDSHNNCSAMSDP
jgi:hypothetical protein